MNYTFQKIEGCQDTPSGQHKDELAHTQSHKVQVVNPVSISEYTLDAQHSKVVASKHHGQGVFGVSPSGVQVNYIFGGIQ